MYDVYFGNLLLPVTPAKIQLRIKNQNKTINLINEGEVNLLKRAGLTDITLTVLLPNVQYPFARYKSGFRAAAFFLSEFEKLKTQRDSKGKFKPFQFIVSRSMPNGRNLFDNNIQVSLEDYSIADDTKEGFDISVNVRLKQFVNYGTKTVQITIQQERPIAVVEPQRPATTAPPIGVGSDVIVNGRLHRDSYGNGAGQMRENYRGKINFTNTRGSHPFHVTTPQGGWLGWVTADSVRAV